MQFSPKSVTMHETDPSSVASFSAYLKHADNTEITHVSIPADPSGNTKINISDMIALDPTLVGQIVRVSVREVGGDGQLGPVQDITNPTNGTLDFVVSEAPPDGAESYTVEL